VVESYLDCFLDEAVHESYGDATSPWFKVPLNRKFIRQNLPTRNLL
jgi:hypothetical protein